jgi:hypothetical protein
VQALDLVIARDATGRDSLDKWVMGNDDMVKLLLGYSITLKKVNRKDLVGGFHWSENVGLTFGMLQGKEHQCRSHLSVCKQGAASGICC